MDASEDQQQPEPIDYGENFKKLPADRVEQLRAIVSSCNGKRDQWARMVEVIRCTLRRYFWLGIQHGFWNADTNQMQIGPAGGSVSGENLNDEDLFAGDFNIYTQNGKIFISVFSQTAASTHMEPDKPEDADSVAAAAEAEKYVQVYEKYNPPKVAQQEVARLFWTDGRVLAVTKYDENEDILGVEIDEEGNEVPRGTELTEYFGVLETKVPIVESYAKWPYCKVSREIDIWTAKDENPDFASQLQESSKGLSPNDEIARMSRIATAENIAQVSSDTLAYLVTEDTWWLRPAAFRDLDEAGRLFFVGGDVTGEDGSVTKQNGIFPNGCRLKFFGSVYCGATAVAMNKEVRVCHAMPGTGNSRPSLSDALIPIQMEFNDAVGMYSEMLHKCIPRIWINAGPEEIAAILEQASRYGEFSPFVKPTGEPLQNNFFPEPAIAMPDGFAQWVENLQGPLSQFVTGNSPALFGQNMEDQKTAKGYAMARDQALGLMAIVWVPYLQFAGHIRAQAARTAAQRDGDQISAIVPDQKGKPQSLSIDLQKMRKGGFLTAPVTDQNFPESWTETSNTWKMLLANSAQNAFLAEQLIQPDNQVGMRDAIGLKNFVLVGADSRDLQMAEWAEMQDGSGPVPDLVATEARDAQKQQMAQAAIDHLAPGQQAPPLPAEPAIMVSSVPIDPETDDHVVHALEMFRILNGAEGQKIKKAKKAVWDDGKLHMMAHVAAATAKGLVIPPPLGGPPPVPVKPALPAAAPNPTGADNASATPAA